MKGSEEKRKNMNDASVRTSRISVDVFFLHRVIYFQLIHLFGKIKWNNKELTKFVEKETFKEMKRQERKLEKREREREREREKSEQQ